MEISIKTVKPTIRINFILDESYSMNDQRDAVIGGFNEYLDTHKNKTDANYLVTLVKFSNHNNINVVFAGKPVSEVRHITREDYTPQGGTALYDAIARTVELTESLMRETSVPSNVLTFIFTDGDENDSKVYPRWTAYNVENGTTRINRMITTKEDSGHWTFSFVGSSRDALKEAQAIGISLGNSFQWNYSNCSNTLSAMSAVTSNYTTAVNNSLDSRGDGTVYTRSLFKDSGIQSDADIDKIANMIKTSTTSSN